MALGRRSVPMKDMNQGYKIGNTYISDEFTVRISWLLPATIAPLAMVIHLLNGNSRDFPFFISEADYPGVERWVFTIGLALSGLFQMIFAYRMWHKMRHSGRPKLLFAAMISGLFTGANLFVMSFADMYDHLELHVLTASLVFQVGILWAILAHFALPNAHKSGRRLRVIGILVSFISYIVMSQAIVRAIRDLDSFGLEDDTMFTLDRIQYAVDVAAYAEYTLFAGLIICLYSFERDLLSFNSSSEE